MTLLPSAFPSSQASTQHLTSFLINSNVAVDAGALGLFGSAQEQARVRHVFLTHSHLDHVTTLPMFVENAREDGRDCVVVHGSAAVIDCLRRDVFNGRLWADMAVMCHEKSPFMRLEELRDDEAVHASGLRVTPIPVTHTVPTQGLIVEDDSSAIVITSDTGPTEAIWQRANKLPNLKAVFVEASLPNRLAHLADVTKHLTPALLDAELRKLQRSARVIAVHLKMRWRDEVAAELKALGRPQLEIVEPGRTYTF